MQIRNLEDFITQMPKDLESTMEKARWLYIELGKRSFYDVSYKYLNEDEEKKAPDPYRVLWHVPTAKFSLTMLYNDFSNSNGDEGDNGLENQDFEIKYAGNTVFKCTECYAESITPLIGEKDNYLGYTISGFVNGEITES